MPSFEGLFREVRCVVRIMNHRLAASANEESSLQERPSYVLLVTHENEEDMWKRGVISSYDGMIYRREVSISAITPNSTRNSDFPWEKCQICHIFLDKKGIIYHKCDPIGIGIPIRRTKNFNASHDGTLFTHDFHNSSHFQEVKRGKSEDPRSSRRQGFPGSLPKTILKYPEKSGIEK